MLLLLETNLYISSHQFYYTYPNLEHCFKVLLVLTYIINLANKYPTRATRWQPYDIK